MTDIRNWINGVLLTGVVLLAACGAGGSARAADEIKIVTVMDNEVAAPDLKTGWGFSAVVLTPKTSMIFDTGPDGQALLDNLAKLGLDPKQFSRLVISHTDDDHTAGIPAFEGANPEVEVFLPGRTPGEIGPGLLTTGPMGMKQEQALLIETKDGLVIMTGCAHPGIVEVVTEVERLHPGERILLVMGGFHLFQSADSKVDAIVDKLKALKVEKVAPSHCTGRYARTRFKEVYGADYIAGGVGSTLTFPAP